MNLKNAVLSLIDIFRLNKGQKIVEEPVEPLAPLIQRLGLPAMPSDFRSIADRREFVLGVIREKYPMKISRRVLGEIVRHYGVDLYGCRDHNQPIFRGIPNRSRMLKVLQPELVNA